MVRCFISVELPKEIRTNLMDLQKELKTTRNTIKMVAPKHIHITLKFLGEISEQELENVKEKLKNIEFKKFQIRLQDLLSFPSEQKPRVISVGVQPQGDLVLLNNEINNQLSTKEDREYIPHATIARIKFVKREKNLLNFIKDKKYFSTEKFIVEKFALMMSILTKDGARHKRLEEYNATDSN